jgi:tripartite-type tricarboxylate transporter receptor subunit TctC
VSRFAIAFLAALLPTLGSAQPYPAKPVRIIVPAQPGGGLDLIGRTVADQLGRALEQSFVVENIGGGGGAIACQTVARAAPDGYTLMMTTNTPQAANVSLFKKLNYDPVKDFAPVALCFTTPLYLVVHPSLPVRSVKELIALAKSRPGRLTFASGGNGTTNHLAGELFKALARVDMRHVPYKSAGPAMIDVMAGHVDMMFGGAGLADAQAGKVRVLAATSARRTAAALELPTVQEAGLPGYEATLWFGILAPANTPVAIVNRLSQDINNVLGQPAMRQRFSTGDITPSTPEEFADLIKREIPKWRKVIESAKIEPE